MPGHVPVLLDEVLRCLRAGESRHGLDATFGGGGHSRALLETRPDFDLVALDRDPAAAERSEPLRENFPDRFRLVHASFADLADHIRPASRDAILFDLGLSSFQVDQGERGFSFRTDAPADMRMDPTSGQPASAFLESASEADLVAAIRNFGEEPRWRRVVSAIIAARGTGQLARTASLAALIADALGPAAARRSRTHPATRSFQGIRIAVNGELAALEAALPAAFAALEPGGRLVVISFHSLEDRRVKRYFRQLAGEPINRFDARPEEERHRHRMARLISRSAIKPTEAEIATNPRARSARLRALEKLPT
jgi:16S rRNA (cytosine1402-N4)-methyltransferase